MKPKLIALVVAGAVLAASTLTVSAQTDPPPGDGGGGTNNIVATCVIGVLAIGVGAVVVYGLYKMCQKIPNPAPIIGDVPDDVKPSVPTAPPGTNNPATNWAPRRLYAPAINLGVFKASTNVVTFACQTAGPDGVFKTGFLIRIDPAMGMMAADPQGNLLGTINPVTVWSDSEQQQYSIFDFTGVAPVEPDAGMKLWRLAQVNP